MTIKRAGNNQFLKERNQAAILDLIRINKALSKAELAHLTGLSPTAAGSIVANLIEKGYIHETGTGKSKGGRKPVMLELKPLSAYSLGIDLDVEYMDIILVDITGRIVGEKLSTLPKAISFDETATLLQSSAKEITEKYAAGGKLLGIGVSVAGVADVKTGEILLAPNLGWKNINVKAKLQELFKVPVYVLNEAMASAVCENWIGSCKDTDNFVCINVKSGIGAGIFTGGRLYTGSSGSAGEIGHIAVSENGPRCGCGNYGCLETMASTSRIVEQVKRLVREGVVSSLNQLPDIDRIVIDDIIKAARAYDSAAIGVLAEAARYLGIAVSNIVNTLNPSKVIIGKDFIKYSDLVIEHIKSIVSLKALNHAARTVTIEASSVGEKSSALGAAILPLKLLFGR